MGLLSKSQALREVEGGEPVQVVGELDELPRSFRDEVGVSGVDVETASDPEDTARNKVRAEVDIEGGIFQQGTELEDDDWGVGEEETGVKIKGDRGPVLVAATEGHAEDLGRVPRGVDDRGAVLLTGAFDQSGKPVPVRLPFWQGEAGFEDGNHDFLKKGASVYG